MKREILQTAIIYENKSVNWVAYTEYCGVKLDIEKWKYKMILDNFNAKVFEDALSDWVIAAAKGEPYSYHYLQVEGGQTQRIYREPEKRCKVKDVQRQILKDL